MDKVDGKLIGTIQVSITGGNDRWDLVKNDVKKYQTYMIFILYLQEKRLFKFYIFDYWIYSR